VNQDVFNLVRLFDPYRYSDGIYRRFDENSFVFIARNRERVQQELRRLAGLDLWNIVTFDRLRRKVAQRKRGSEGCADAGEVRP
jgi:hypothetical protein